MPTNHTTNYRLSQWEKSDQVRMEDFNGDNAKIDAALGTLRDGKAEASEVPRLDAAIASKVSIVTGTYQGDGQPSQFINLGFTPKALFVTTASGVTASPVSVIHYGGMALLDHPITYDNDPVLAIVENGFQVYYNSHNHILSNESKVAFFYLAFR